MCSNFFQIFLLFIFFFQNNKNFLECSRFVKLLRIFLESISIFFYSLFLSFLLIVSYATKQSLCGTYFTIMQKIKFSKLGDYLLEGQDAKPQQWEEGDPFHPSPSLVNLNVSKYIRQQIAIELKLLTLGLSLKEGLNTTSRYGALNISSLYCGGNANSGGCVCSTSKDAGELCPRDCRNFRFRFRLEEFSGDSDLFHFRFCWPTQLLKCCQIKQHPLVRQHTFYL